MKRGADLMSDDDPMRDYELEEEELPRSFTRSEDDLEEHLFQAVANGDLWGVHELLECDHVDINVKDNHGLTPLHRACKNDHLEVAKLLIAYGAMVDPTEPLWGYTRRNLAIAKLLIANGINVNAQKGVYRPSSLHFVCWQGCLEMASLLLQNGARVNATMKMLSLRYDKGDYEEDYERITPLSHAIGYSHWKVAKLLIENGGAVYYLNGQTLLHRLCAKGNLELVKSLVQNDASDINAKNNSGQTPLILACLNGDLNGDLEIIKLLLKNGAIVHAGLWSYTGYNLEIADLLIKNGLDVNAVQDDGWTTLHYASDYGYLETVRWLIQNGAEVNQPPLFELSEYYDDGKVDCERATPLYLAIMSQNWEIAKLLIENGGTVYYASGGWTLLHETCEGGKLELVKSLIKTDAQDINAKDDAGKTALTHACEKNHFEIVKSLIENGADVNAKDQNGRTPLTYACQNSLLGIVNHLINNGAFVNAKNHGGWTPIFWACKGGNTLIVTLLVLNGADFKLKDKYGRSVLHLVCWEERHFEIAKFLIENGVNVNVKEADGKTALHAACRQGHLKLVQLLLSRGAIVTTETTEGVTPLHLACKGNHLEIVWLLLRRHPCLVAGHI